MYLSDVKPIEDSASAVQADTKEHMNDESDERAQIKQAIEEEETQYEEQPSVAGFLNSVGVEQPKPKQKRKTPIKKTQAKEENVEPIVEQVEELVVEAKEEAPKEATPKQREKKIKTVELHKCEKCNKEMTQRALRYTHPQYCTGREVNRNEVPVKRQTKPATIINNVVEITPDIIENHLRKVKENKLKERQEKISKLISKIA